MHHGLCTFVGLRTRECTDQRAYELSSSQSQLRRCLSCDLQPRRTTTSTALLICLSLGASSFPTMRTIPNSDECTANGPQPTFEKALRTSTRSWHYWQKLLKSAECIKNYPNSCYNIQSLLNQTPSIPRHPNITEYVGNSLCLEGFSEWDIGYWDDCSLECTTKSSRHQRVPIGSLKLNFC